MKKLNITTALVASVFLLAGSASQAEETKKKIETPSRYWTFLQGLEKGLSDSKTDELSDMIETLNDLSKARTEFEKTCAKTVDPKCRELLESYLKIEISAVEAIKKDIFETGVDLKTAMRNLSALKS